MTSQRFFIMLCTAAMLWATACTDDTTPASPDGDSADTLVETEETVTETDAEPETETEIPEGCNEQRFPLLGGDCEAYYGCYGTWQCNDDATDLVCEPRPDCPPQEDGDTDSVDTDPDVVDTDGDVADSDPDPVDSDPDVDTDPDIDTDPDPVDTDPGTIVGCKVLFDNAHAQTASNADWTISGGFSDFGDALEDLQMVVDEWGNDESSRQDENDGPITYSELSKHDVYIIPEPNVPFTRSEQEAIARFVEEGGGLFIIADHVGADRNNDGWDAVEIFNGFQNNSDDLVSPHDPEDEFVPKYFGVSFIERSFSMDPITDIDRSHPVTEGVYSVGMWAGTTMRVHDTQKVTGLIYLDGETFKGPYLAVSSHGVGKVVLLGDSSPGDDGTGAPGDTLYDGWNFGDNADMHINAAKWLCR